MGGGEPGSKWGGMTGLIADILLRIRACMLAGRLSPAVATMNAVHALAEVTGVDASR